MFMAIIIPKRGFSVGSCITKKRSLNTRKETLLTFRLEQLVETSAKRIKVGIQRAFLC